MPRYRSLVVGRTRCLDPDGSVYAVSLTIGPRYLGGENIITSVLSASVDKPFVLSHLSDTSSFEMACSVALRGVAETARIAPSSTYIESAACSHDLLVWRRNDVNRAERMGERGDPYGVPSRMGKGSDVTESIFMTADRSVRNEYIQFTTLRGKPFLLHMSLARLASM